MTLNGILAKKIEQTQSFNEKGLRIPVTKMVAGPCMVMGVSRHNLYQTIQMGFGTAKKIANKVTQGQIRGANLKNAPLFLREFKTDLNDSYEVGKPINIADIFKVGDKVKVTGKSKGKGFAGVVKRHHFHGGPKTHGQSDRHRAPGSIGSTTTPGRVYRGKRMAGRMGGVTATIKGLEVVAIDEEKKLLTLKGLVPGGRNGLVTIIKLP